MKSAIVLGGASSVFDEASHASQFGNYDLTIACNAVGTRWAGPIDIWCTLHPEKMAGWRDDRERAGFRPASMHIGYKRGNEIDQVHEYRFDGQSSSGSTGLFAVKLAIDEGCDRIVLAGVPMETEGAHFDCEKPWGDCRDFMPAWEQVLPVIKDVTTSMSGWTAERLGMPTKEWLSAL